MSLVILCLSMTGVIVLSRDIPEANELFALEYMEHFEMVFFVLTGIVEFVATGVYSRLWNEVKNDNTTTILSQGDAMYSSLFTLLRMFWTISSSIYVFGRRASENDLLDNPTPELQNRLRR